MSDQREVDGTRRERILASIPWGWVVPTLIGFGIGLYLAFEYVWLDRPWTGLLPPTFVVVAPAFLGGGGVLVLSLILLVPERTRQAGYAGFRLLLGALVAAPIGLAIAPRYQFGGDVTGTLQIRFTAPVAATVDYEATCRIEDNGTAIIAIRSETPGHVGIDRIAARVAMGSASGAITVLVNEFSGYEGSIAITSAGADRLAGSATFASSHAGRVRLGGADGAASIAGELSWACGETPAASVEDPSQVDQDPLQGWFSLSGVVDMPHPCSGDGPCLPHGRAMATCYRALPFRANHFETVVPWIGESQARLVLDMAVPSASLTIERDDGSPVERVTGTGNVAERLVGGHSYDRVASADFVLAGGPLHVEVEYSCSDNVEPYPDEGAGDGVVPGAFGTPVPVGAGRWLATASGATPDGAVRLAFDGDRKTLWNSGAGPEQWIQVDLGEPRTLRVVRLTPAQYPSSGHTVHQVLVGATEGEFRIAHVFDGETTDGLLLVQTFDPPLDGVRYVRILTLESSSWVAWFEIQLAVD